MIEWLYLAGGMALILILLRGRHPAATSSIWIFWFKNFLGLVILFEIHALSNFYLWARAGREDLGLVFLFFLALVIDEGIRRIGGKKSQKTEVRLLVPPSFLVLAGLSLWVVWGDEGRILASLALPLAAGLLEWLLEGLRARLRLSNVPKAFEGAPVLFLTAALLFLAFYGFFGMDSRFVN